VKSSIGEIASKASAIPIVRNHWYESRCTATRSRGGICSRALPQFRRKFVLFLVIFFLPILLFPTSPVLLFKIRKNPGFPRFSSFVYSFFMRKRIVVSDGMCTVGIFSLIANCFFKKQKIDVQKVRLFWKGSFCL